MGPRMDQATSRVGGVRSPRKGAVLSQLNLGNGMYGPPITNVASVSVAPRFVAQARPAS